MVPHDYYKLKSLDESLPDGGSIKVRLVGSIANDFPSETIGVSDDIVLQSSLLN